MVRIAALVIGLMLLYADVLASFVILRDRELSRLTWMLLFVWCVPFLGAVLAQVGDLNVGAFNAAAGDSSAPGGDGGGE
jgi:hypothetical protein